jgi:hypothetical protein
MLVVAERFDPGWRATVAGRPLDVLRVNGEFIGCQVGPGRERVVLEFRPRSLEVGWAISEVGAAVIVLHLLLLFCDGQKWPPPVGGLKVREAVLYWWSVKIFRFHKMGRIRTTCRQP